MPSARLLRTPKTVQSVVPWHGRGGRVAFAVLCLVASATRPSISWADGDNAESRLRARVRVLSELPSICRRLISASKRPVESTFQRSDLRGWEEQVCGKRTQNECYVDPIDTTKRGQKSLFEAVGHYCFGSPAKPPPIDKDTADALDESCAKLYVTGLPESEAKLAGGNDECGRTYQPRGETRTRGAPLPLLEPIGIASAVTAVVEAKAVEEAEAFLRDQVAHLLASAEAKDIQLFLPSTVDFARTTTAAGSALRAVTWSALRGALESDLRHLPRGIAQYLGEKRLQAQCLPRNVLAVIGLHSLDVLLTSPLPRSMVPDVQERWRKTSKEGCSKGDQERPDPGMRLLALFETVYRSDELLEARADVIDRVIAGVLQPNGTAPELLVEARPAIERFMVEARIVRDSIEIIADAQKPSDVREEQSRQLALQYLRLLRSAMDVVLAFDTSLDRETRATADLLVDLAEASLSKAPARLVTTAVHLLDIEGARLPEAATALISFASGVVAAKSDEDVKAAAEALIGPSASWRAKRKLGGSGVYINAFVGLQGVAALPAVAGADIDERFAVRLHASLGLLPSMRFDAVPLTLAIYLPILDLSPLASFSTKDSDRGELRFEQILSFGAHVLVGLGPSPFVAGAGVTYQPFARDVEAPTLRPARELTVGLFFAIDVGLMRLF